MWGEGPVGNDRLRSAEVVRPQTVIPGVESHCARKDEVFNVGKISKTYISRHDLLRRRRPLGKVVMVREIVMRP